jgi:radical SAM protein with 4Fe4S-binding SPASM domain
MVPTYHVTENDRVKIAAADGYNYIFDKVTGNFVRWGKTKEDDPEMAPCPEILDIEISTACDGVPDVDGKTSPCRFCYKANKRTGTQMSFETYQELFARLPKTVTQIAFGITNIYGYDDMWRIFEYTRANGVVPNVTINGHGLTDEFADRLVSLMGAVAVSRYEPSDTCYDAVKALTDRGMSQVNIHQLVSEESYEGCLQVLKDMREDPRLEKLNAVVFLVHKPKGRGVPLTPLRDAEKYKAMIDYALEHGLNVGFDSCSVPSFLNAVEGHPNFKMFEQATDRCESGLFSLYIDVHGRAWPCSFGQERHDLESIDILSIENFEEEVWRGPELNRWRDRLHSNCRSCPLYDIDIGRCNG